MDTITLSVGGFSLLLTFTKTEFTTRKIVLADFIRQRYKAFLLEKPPRRIDYHIRFVYRQAIRSLTSPSGNHVFFNLYDQTGKTALTTFYHISLFQFDVILTHVLQDLLAKHHGFILHTSAVAISGKAYCFMGKSGAGKSTAVRLLSGVYPPLSDDSGIIRKENGMYVFYQMPLVDKNEQRTASSRSLPLGGICFLHKSSSYRIHLLSNKENILTAFSTQLYSEKHAMPQQIVSLTAFVNQFSFFYDVFFGKDEKNMIELFSSL